MIDTVSKFKMDEMKFSLFRMDRMVFQSGMVSVSLVASSNRQIDSSANLTIAGGLAIDRTSDNCFFFIPLTADDSIKKKIFFLFNRRTQKFTKYKWLENLVECVKNNTQSVCMCGGRVLQSNQIYYIVTNLKFELKIEKQKKTKTESSPIWHTLLSIKHSRFDQRQIGHDKFSFLFDFHRLIG